MAEELKHLIDQIQKEGVAKADSEAQQILSQAKEKAAKIVSDAEAKAKDVVAKADVEATAFAQRGVKTLEQSARDLLITVGQGVENVITAILQQETDAALTSDLLEKLILDVCKGSNATVSVSETDKQALTAFAAGKAKEKMTGGLVLQSDNEILKGFKVDIKDKNLYLDFTGEAIAETLSAFLRPELAKIVSNAAKEQLNK